MGRMTVEQAWETMEVAAACLQFEKHLNTAAELRAALATLRAELDGLRAENEILAHQRDHARASFDSASKILHRIHAVIYPQIVELDDGRRFNFQSPHLHEQMQAISDRIRAIPYELAAIDAARQEKGHE